MTQDRSINIFGKMEGTNNTGDGATIIQTKQENKRDVSEEIKEILEQLEKKYSGAPETDKEIVLKMEIQHKLRSDPTFKQRFISAAKSGGMELIKVVTDNPFVSVPLETVKGWIEAESAP